ncbi:MAG: OB-fold domain-containing protein [Negativicutes bacterium]
MQIGQIYSFSIVFSSTEALKDKTPYLAAIVEKPDGKKVSAMVEGYSPDVNVVIGSKVEIHNDPSGGFIYRLLQ